MKLQINLLFQFHLLLVLSIATLAQASRPIPTLTTDDIASSRAVVPAPSAPAKEAAKNTGQGEKNATQNEPGTGEIKSEDAKKSAEKNWNERLRKAQEKARMQDQQADQVELAITELRNQLFSAAAKAPEASGQINARIAELFAQMNRLRADAETTRQEIEVLQAEGAANQYKVQQVSLTNEKGEPDKQAYKSEYDKLHSELQAAYARVEVLQLRLNSNHGEMLKRANGDNFTLNKLRQEREQITEELEKTQTKIIDLKNELESHRRKADAAGIVLR